MADLTPWLSNYADVMPLHQPPPSTPFSPPPPASRVRFWVVSCEAHSGHTPVVLTAGSTPSVRIMGTLLHNSVCPRPIYPLSSLILDIRGKKPLVVDWMVWCHSDTIYSGVDVPKRPAILTPVRFFFCLKTQTPFTLQSSETTNLEATKPTTPIRIPLPSVRSLDLFIHPKFAAHK